MAFDFLIRGLNKTVGDGTLSEDEAMVVSNRKGCITSCIAAGSEVPSLHLTGRQVPPKFIVVRCDIPAVEAQQFCDPWKPEVSISWEAVGQSGNRRVTLASGLVRARDNHGGMNDATARGFLEAWGFSGHAFGANQAVSITHPIAMAASDRGLSYRGQFSSTPTQEELEAAFAEDVEVKLEKKIALRRYRLAESEVDRVIASGGFDEVTATAFRSNMQDMLDA